MKKKTLIVLFLFFSVFAFTDNIISFEGISTIQMKEEKSIVLTPETYRKILDILTHLLELSTNNILNGRYSLYEPFMYEYMILHHDLSYTVTFKKASILVYEPTHPNANYEGYYWKKEFDYNEELANLAKIISLLQKLESMDKDYYLTITDPVLSQKILDDAFKMLEEIGRENFIIHSNETR